jgi:hypothetical protein
VPARPVRAARPARAGRVPRSFALVAAVLLIAAAGCSGSDSDARDGAVAGPGTTAEAAEVTTTTSAVAPAGSGDAGISALPPAPALPQVADEGPIPAKVEIGALDVAAAPVVAVGVEDNGDMEIPGVDEVGWYRFGSRPGEPGSTVLAAHVAYDGVDGVFRHLDDLAAGDEVVLTDDAGAASRFVVTEVARYPKTALPDRVFATDGDPGLVLVTCGGAFDAGAGHYEDNVIAFAVPS